MITMTDNDIFINILKYEKKLYKELKDIEQEFGLESYVADIARARWAAVVDMRKELWFSV